MKNHFRYPLLLLLLFASIAVSCKVDEDDQPAEGLESPITVLFSDIELTECGTEIILESGISLYVEGFPEDNCVSGVTTSFGETGLMLAPARLVMDFTAIFGASKISVTTIDNCNPCTEAAIYHNGEEVERIAHTKEAGEQEVLVFDQLEEGTNRLTVESLEGFVLKVVIE